MSVHPARVQVVSELELDDVLQGMAKLDTGTLEQFLQDVGRLLAQRRAGHLPQREAELLERIAVYLPEAVQERYHALNGKLHDAGLSDAERQEFLALVDQVEMADAARLQAVIELAQLRGVGVDEILRDLRPAAASDA